MPVRRINYTHRKRIAHAEVEIRLACGSDGIDSFDCHLDLSSHGFPADARVFVEAYRQTTLMRFGWGTVSVPAPPLDRRLAQFESSDEILFRVRVTSATGKAGLLLGEAEKIRPRHPDEEPDKRLPLLPIAPEDLDEEVWRLDFEGEVCLRINSRLPDWKQTARSDVFRALVFPAAMRQVLERILKAESYVTTDDPNDWRSLWLRFAAALPGSSPPPRTQDGFDDWIENAVAAFARRFNLRSRFATVAGE